MKLKQLNSILTRTPFRAISQLTGSGTLFKFYDARSWDHTCSPDWHEVTGNEVYGFARSKLYAQGIVLGYAQNRTIRVTSSTL